MINVMTARTKRVKRIRRKRIRSAVILHQTRPAQVTVATQVVRTQAAPLQAPIRVSKTLAEKSTILFKKFPSHVDHIIYQAVS